jgi:hypothetical protein
VAVVADNVDPHDRTWRVVLPDAAQHRPGEMCHICAGAGADEIASLALHIIQNEMLSDGAIRMASK